MDSYLEWAKPYIRQRNVLKKDILEIIPLDDYLVVSKKEYSYIYIAVGKSPLATFLSRDFNMYSSIWFICDNSSSRVQDVLDNWKLLSSNPKFRLICINLSTGSKWLLNPSLHAKIVFPESLKKTLTSICSNS